MNFLNHREGGMAFISVLLPFSFTVYSYTLFKLEGEIEDIEISLQSCRGDCE
jgi:hypothetical protein